MKLTPEHRPAAALLSATLVLAAYAGEKPAPAVVDGSAAPSQVSFKQASAAGKHLFILFYEADNEATQAARKTLDAVLVKRADVARQIAVKKDAPEEMALVEKYRLQTAPMPLLLVLAPNGAVTMGCLGKDISEERARAAIAGPAQQQCLKALQDGKVVVLYACGKSVPDDSPLLKGIRDFRADPKYAEAEVIRLDSSDEAESAFLKQLNITPKARMTTLVMAPPRTILKRFAGQITKDGLASALKPAPG
jgi:hypothetical protein